MKYHVEEIITELTGESIRQVNFIEKEIRPLSEEDLTWRPGPYKWNIFEVVEHLNRFSDFYLPKLSLAVRRPKALAKGKVYKSGYLGEFAFNRIRPVDGIVPYKTKSLNRNNPFLRILDSSVLDEHIQQQETFRQLLEDSIAVSWGKNKVPTMVGNWLRLNLGDSFRILAYHTERHYVQIEELLERKI